MLEQLIRRLAPAQIDSQMLLITEACLLVLLSVFLVFGFWIFSRISFRYFQIVFSRFKIRKILKKTDELRAARTNLKVRLFKKIRWAKEPFKAFHLAWEEARPQGEAKAILPIRLREFLTPEIVLDGARNRRIAEALPGIFVGLGIFGTFLGLVLGLRELEFGKLENLQNGVGHLISGLSLAFLTSLGGIALSIIFSLLYRFAISRLETSFLSLDVLLSRAYPFDPQERYARRMYEMQADIKQGLQTLATDVATQISGTIGSKLGEAIENHLVPVIKDVHGWIENSIQSSQQQQTKLTEGFNDHLTRLSKVISEHFQNSQDRQTEAMEAVLQHYSVALTETFQDQFQSMGQIIADTTEAQKEIKMQLVAFGEQLQMQFQSQGELIEKTNRAGQILSESLEGLESIAQKLKSAMNDIGSAAKMLENSAITAKEGQEILKDTMERQIATMARTREELESTWHSVTENAQNLVHQIRQAVQDLANIVGENLVHALNSFDGKVAEVVERFSGTLFETNQTISEIPSLVVNMSEIVDTIGNAISEQKEIVNGLKEASEEVISKNLHAAAAATEKLAESTSQIASSTNEMRSFLGSYFENIKENANSFTESNQATISEFNRIVNELIIEIRLMQSLFDTNGLTSTLKHLQELSLGKPEKYNGDDLARAISIPLNDLNKQLENLQEAVSNFKGNGSGEKSANNMYNVMVEIDQRIEPLPTWFETVVSRLDDLSRLAGKLDSEFEEIRSSSKNESNFENRWWQFGRGAKK